ncbi:MAG: thiol reductant ABC exporter subunit CydC [Vicinamibacterales bacterium]
MSAPWLALARLARPLARRLAAGAVLMALTIAASVALMGTSGWLIASAALQPPLAALQVAIVGVRFFGIARGVARYAERLVSHDATLRLLARLRVRVFRGLAPLVPGLWRRHASGDVLTRLMADVDVVDHAYLQVAGPFTAAIAVTLLATWIVGTIDTGAALLVGAGLALGGVALPALAWRLGHRAEAERVATTADLQASLVDGVQGAADLLAFGAAGRHVAHVEALAARAGRAQAAADRATAFGTSATGALADLSAVAVIAWLAPAVAAGDVSGVQLTVAALVTLAAFEAVAPLPGAAQSLAATRAAALRLFPPPGETAAPLARVVGASDDGGSPAGTTLDVRDLAFRYPGAAAVALDGVSLTLEPGRLIGLAGDSGSGKSTLVQLLLRFYEPSGGTILLDGVYLTDVDEATLRRSIGWMAQRTDIFTGTLAENLRLAQPGADDRALLDALGRAGLGDTVAGWPDGLATWIGEQGATLSGGERQRLALARVLLGNAPIVLLDEPASQVDAATARLIADEARRLAGRRAVLLVSHRIDALAAADEIVVLEGGRVVERGGFDALVSRPDGRFRRLLEHERAFGAGG